jgi:hypothetical protein
MRRQAALVGNSIADECSALCTLNNELRDGKLGAYYVAYFSESGKKPSGDVKGTYFDAAPTRQIGGRQVSRDRRNRS